MKILFLTVLSLCAFISFGQIQNAEARAYVRFYVGAVGPTYVVPRAHYVAPYYYVQRPVYGGPRYVVPQSYYYYPRYAYYYYR